MTKISELQTWNVQDYLKTPEDCALFIQAAILEGDNDPGMLTSALREVSRARGMAQTARDSGLTREGLYKALAEDGRPSFDTISKVLRAFGLQVSVTPIEGAAH